jgi:hypothetical protein
MMGIILMLLVVVASKGHPPTGLLGPVGNLNLPQVCAQRQWGWGMGEALGIETDLECKRVTKEYQKDSVKLHRPQAIHDVLGLSIMNSDACCLVCPTRTAGSQWHPTH